MKRLITFVCLIIIISLGYTLITKGFESDFFGVASYKKIEEKSEGLTKKLAVYDKKNQEEYETAVTNLNSSIKNFNDSKEKYETIFKEFSNTLDKDDENEVLEEVIYSDKEKYKIDFLLVILGDYGEQEGVDVVFNLLTSSTVDPNSSALNYFLSDLKFTITGQYMDVADFISDLENDDRLGWEIRDFSMSQGSNNGYSGVVASFTIKDIPIDSESYIASSSYVNESNDAVKETNSTSEDEKATNTESSSENSNSSVENKISNNDSSIDNKVSNDNTSIDNKVSNNTSIANNTSNSVN